MSKLGDDPSRVIFSVTTAEEYKLGDLAQRSDSVGDLARQVLATGKVQCLGCDQRRRAGGAFFEYEGAPAVWLCNDCHKGMIRSRKRYKQVAANMKRHLPEARIPGLEETT